MSFILSHTGKGKGKGGTEGGEKKEDSLARVGPASRKEETVLFHLKDLAEGGGMGWG